jgi:hypothetical protein
MKTDLETDLSWKYGEIAVTKPDLILLLDDFRQSATGEDTRRAVNEML